MIFMLQEENIRQEETFTTNSNDFKTTTYMDPEWQEVFWKLLKLGLSMAGIVFVRGQSWLGCLLVQSMSELVMSAHQ